MSGTPHPAIAILAARRKALGMSNLKVGLAAGVAESTVSRGLLGECQLSLVHAAAIAEALGMRFELTRGDA